MKDLSRQMAYARRVKYDAEWDEVKKCARHFAWRGPRGKALTGTAKQLARLMWDRRRFA